MDTLKCVMLNGSPYMTLIIYTTCYDIKSFYMVSTISEKILWRRKLMDEFCTTNQKIAEASLYWPNILDEYNLKMVRVDIRYQLHNYY